MKYQQAYKIAKDVCKHIKVKAGLKLKKVRAIIVGSIRRRCKVNKDIDILLVMKPTTTKVELVIPNHYKYKIIRSGNHLQGGFITAYRKRIRIDFFFTTKAQLPLAMFHFTSGRQYNIRIRRYAKLKGCHLNQYELTDHGRHIPIKKERDITNYLGTHYYSPAKRL